jgi:hypothetical protein
MDQVYLIKKTNQKGFEYVELAFNDYSDARKMAIKLVDSQNKKNEKKLFQEISDENRALVETVPDKWSNGFRQIEITALKMKKMSYFSKLDQPKQAFVRNIRKNEEVYL